MKDYSQALTVNPREISMNFTPKNELTTLRQINCNISTTMSEVAEYGNSFSNGITSVMVDF